MKDYIIRTDTGRAVSQEGVDRGTFLEAMAEISLDVPVVPVPGESAEDAEQRWAALKETAAERPSVEQKVECHATKVCDALIPWLDAKAYWCEFTDRLTVIAAGHDITAAIEQQKLAWLKDWARCCGTDLGPIL